MRFALAWVEPGMNPRARSSGRRTSTSSVVLDRAKQRRSTARVSRHRQHVLRGHAGKVTGVFCRSVGRRVSKFLFGPRSMTVIRAWERGRQHVNGVCPHLHGRWACGPENLGRFRRTAAWTCDRWDPPTSRPAAIPDHHRHGAAGSRRYNARNWRRFHALPAFHRFGSRTVHVVLSSSHMVTHFSSVRFLAVRLNRFDGFSPASQSAQPERQMAVLNGDPHSHGNSDGSAPGPLPFNSRSARSQSQSHGRGRFLAPVEFISRGVRSFLGSGFFSPFEPCLC